MWELCAGGRWPTRIEDRHAGVAGSQSSRTVLGVPQHDDIGVILHRAHGVLECLALQGEGVLIVSAGG